MKPDFDTVKLAFPEAVQIRGKTYLHQMTVDKFLDGIPLCFTRRRYPGMTYTWVEAFLAGEWVNLGDPWPCLMPPVQEVREALKRFAPQLAPQTEG